MPREVVDDVKTIVVRVVAPPTEEAVKREEAIREETRRQAEQIKKQAEETKQQAEEAARQGRWDEYERLMEQYRQLLEQYRALAERAAMPAIPTEEIVKWGLLLVLGAVGGYALYKAVTKR